MQNATIPRCSQELLPFLSGICFFLSTLLHHLLFHSPSLHLVIYFFVYLSILLFPNSYIKPFWEFCFLPFSVRAQTNVNYLTLLSLLQWGFFNNCTDFFIDSEIPIFFLIVIHRVLNSSGHSSPQKCLLLKISGQEM